MYVTVEGQESVATLSFALDLAGPPPATPGPLPEPPAGPPPAEFAPLAGSPAPAVVSVLLPGNETPPGVATPQAQAVPSDFTAKLW